MFRRAVKAAYHTEEEVSEYLAVALKIAAAHDLSPELTEATLPKLLELLALSHIQFEQVGPLGIPNMAIPRG